MSLPESRWTLLPIERPLLSDNSVSNASGSDEDLVILGDVVGIA